MMEQLLMYKGYALMRQANIMYYGNMSDKHIIMLQVLSSKDIDGESTSDKISVLLLLTDETIPAKDRIVNKAEKEGMYDALELSNVWLSRANKNA